MVHCASCDELRDLLGALRLHIDHTSACVGGISSQETGEGRCLACAVDSSLKAKPIQRGKPAPRICHECGGPSVYRESSTGHHYCEVHVVPLFTKLGLRVWLKREEGMPTG